MPSVMIIGASRGIGLGFVRAYAADGWRVHATTRTLDRPGELGDVPGDVTLHQLNVVDPAEIAALADAFAGRSLDVLIHNAGVYGTGMRREEVMAVNAAAPFEVIAALLPAVERGEQKKIAILTSHMGSRGGRGTPSGAYGASKAALNDRFREVEPQWRACGIAALVLHPGWVRTDMGGRGAPVAVADSVAGMRRVIDDLTLQDGGRFLDYRGREVSW